MPFTKLHGLGRQEIRLSAVRRTAIWRHARASCDTVCSDISPRNICSCIQAGKSVRFYHDWKSRIVLGHCEGANASRPKFPGVKLGDYAVLVGLLVLSHAIKEVFQCTFTDESASCHFVRDWRGSSGPVVTS